MNELTNQVAVITGAGRGIGQAIALKLAAAGADVACVGRSVDSCKETVEKAKALGRKAWSIAASITEAASVDAAAKEILTAAGKVDILVNNAGVTHDGLLMRMSEADWDTVLDTNLKSMFLFTKAFTRSFLKQQSGRVINITSVVGLMGNAGQCNYAASKAGMIGFTKSAARELASRGITVNAVAPGFIETAMTAKLGEDIRATVVKQIPLGGFGQPEDIANAVLFLASPAARYITGQVIPVDGGMAM